jgi:transcription-repair coupling factor (superfamily II helicase)
MDIASLDVETDVKAAADTDLPVEAPARPEPRVPDVLVAARLVEAARTSVAPIVYIAPSEGRAERIAQAIACFDPEGDTVFLPPWDCLPYDRVPPSRACMGRRMDALRVFLQSSSPAKMLVTSLDAALQRIPPVGVISESRFTLAIGETFDAEAFDHFVRRTGYVEDGLVDEPGEFAFRDDVIDIFPAGGLSPMRIMLADDGTIRELRAYDPMTQRTAYTVEEMVFGPASEAVLPEGVPFDEAASLERSPGDRMERRLFQLYDELPTLFTVLGDARLVLADGIAARLDGALDMIEEARQAHGRLGKVALEARALHLDVAEWTEAVGRMPSFPLDLGGGEALVDFAQADNPRAAFADVVAAQIADGGKVVIAGIGAATESLCRRLQRDGRRGMTTADSWADALSLSGPLLRWSAPIAQGFVDRAAGLAVITARDVFGEGADAPGSRTGLAEPDIQLGDVIVHENHGIGILRGLESVDVDGMAHDAARLEYRDGASILVPMDEFGKLWRYGSAPDAVSLDRLHTDAWSKKRATMDKHIRAAARHLLGLARERQAASVAAITPPRGPYAQFVRRFSYAETADQAAAIEAVLADLASGMVMNRLVCGDVGFGKTEVALRAAAAVALTGAQVVVVCPTTVLARQHLQAFERRFAGTGIGVAMLSRVVPAATAKSVKAGLSDGTIGVVIATQAILAKDVAFRQLGLLIIDEEHRFGTRHKQAMRDLAPHLHTLTLSATPIPRTLQAALIGVQDVSLLTTPPSRRRPVRTSLGPFDRASMRVALLRERRRGGQSFLVVPQIEDIAGVEAILREIVPDLSVKVAHGKMPAASMDAVMVDFADGEGDVLLATNIIESGLDVPRANTIFVWRADRFGLAQLHQLRGRVGRGRTQGVAYLVTGEGETLTEETRIRLASMVEHDRLGAGLALSLEDLDLRGGGDIAGEDQAGHMKVIGISLYQRLLERAVTKLTKGKAKGSAEPDACLNIGIVGSIPQDYVPDATVRLNLYARLLRIGMPSDIDAFSEEFEDRFGALPDEVWILLRLARLRIAVSRVGVQQLDAGPRGMALTFAGKPRQAVLKALLKIQPVAQRDDRLVFERALDTGPDRLTFLEQVFEGKTRQ